jgi:uncharacterized protein involved in outer membrane biogenesis
VKKLLIGALAFLLAAVGAVLVVPSFVDWNRYKNEIAGRIGAATGRSVTLEGDIDLALLPRPTLRVSGARLASLPGAVEPDMVRLKQLDVRVSLMPLLSGTVQVESVTLVEPVIVLEVMPDGRRNWNFPGGSGEGRGRPFGERRLLDSVSLDQLSIDNGTVIYRNAFTGSVERFEAVDAAVVAGSLVGPFQIQSTFTARGVPLAAELSAGRIGEGGAMPLRAALRLPSAEGTLRFAGIVTTGPTPRLQGDLRAEGGDLRAPAGALLKALGRTPLDPMPDMLRQPFNLRTAVNASAVLVELNSVEVQVGDTRGTGNVKFLPGDPGRTPDRAEISLGFNRFDLDSWMTPGEAPKAGAAAGQQAGAGGEPTAPPAFELPQDLEARIALSIDAMGYNQGIVNQGRLEAELAGGVLRLTRAAALLPGGSDVALAGTLRAEAGRPALDMQLEANSDNLRAVLDWLKLEVGSIPADRLRKFSLTAGVSGRPDNLQVSGLDLRLDTSIITGAVAYVDRGRPGIGARLDIDRLNLDAYLPGDGLLAGIDPAGLLTSVDANLEATAESLTLRGVTARDARLDATVANGALTLRRFTAEDLSGTTLDLQGAVARLSPLDGLDLTFTASAESLGPLYRSLGIEPVLPPERVGPVDFSGRVAGDPERLALEVRAEGAGGTVEAGGTLSTPAEVPNYDLKVRATWPDAKPLARMLWPDWRPADPGALDIYAEVQGSDTAVTLSAIQGNVADMPVTGEATIDLAGERPSLQADLQAGEIALDRFLPATATARLPAIPLPVSQAIAAERGIWPDEPLPLGWLGLADGRIGLSAKAIHTGNFRIEEPALRMNLEGDAAVLEQLDGGYAGGRVGLSGRVARGEQGQPEVSGRATLVGIRVDGGLTGTEAEQRLDVTGTLDLQIEGGAKGASPAELIAALDGGGRFALRDGAVIGLDLAGLPAGIGEAVEAKDPAGALDRLLAKAVVGGRTPVGLLETGFRIEKGVAHTDGLRLAAEGAEATGSGTVSLPDRLMELALTVDPAGDAPAFGLALAGPLDRPARKLDVQDLGNWLAAQAEARRPPPPAPAPATAPTPAPAPAPVPEAAEPARRAAPAPAPKPAARPAPRQQAGRTAATPAPAEPSGSEVIEGILDRLRR